MSATLRVNGPCADIHCAEIGRSVAALGAKAGTRPKEGRKPYNPVQ